MTIMRRLPIPLLQIALLFMGMITAAQAEPYPLPPRGEVVPLSTIKDICTHYELPELWTLIETNPPKLPFESDGCSMWPDTWVSGKDLYEGCFVHDLFYWSGIPGDRLARLHADVWLLMWVAENASIELAETMFNGVRMGGGEMLDTPWRWGFGRVDPTKK